ncbi:MAG: DUF11 domain-containing protein [Christensenellaceae bacterium]|jgi:uncharacterized repeat protein (TIGR01451 family)|nr:DUF11 domain-containing protein [Christensenellaceae bacterium]
MYNEHERDRHGGGNGGSGGPNHNRDRIFNRAFIDFNMCGRMRVFESNIVETTRIDIAVEKSQSNPLIFDGDEHEYTVKVINKSMLDIDNVHFKDFLDDGLEYVAGSFKVDGQSEDPKMVGHELSYDIKKLHARKEAILAFRVKMHH